MSGYKKRGYTAEESIEFLQMRGADKNLVRNYFHKGRKEEQERAIETIMQLRRDMYNIYHSDIDFQENTYNKLKDSFKIAIAKMRDQQDE